ncbi:hypothetical protein FH972_023985 [Carpinus fangiana]|uniref:Uncharacterized protein n=1 Tax=Carpinus fangiana TaxID=176857 RepID=A0A5N6KXI8_9ROSI|nr:hypothetical protein FH972_023985 [Carpinus fangiana]
MTLSPPDTGPTRKRKRASQDTPPQSVHRARTGRHRPIFDFDINKLSKIPLCPRVLREFDRRTLHTLRPERSSVRRKLPSSEERDLKRFARSGGPSLDILRSYPDPSGNMLPHRRSDDSRSETATSSSARARKTSAYDNAFEQILEDHGIFMEGYEEAAVPNNFTEITEVLRRRRASLSPSRFGQEDFLRFKKQNTDAKTEMGVMSKSFQVIVGDSNIPNQANIQFSNLSPLTNGASTVPQPAFFDGSRPRDIHRSIRDQLSYYIVPSTDTSNPALPNFFAEVKGPNRHAMTPHTELELYTRSERFLTPKRLLMGTRIH